MSRQPVAIVTGSSRGIGRAIASELGQAGFSLLINYRRNQSAAEAVCQCITDAGGVAASCQADVSVAADRHRLIKQALDSFGRIDVLVNNAGIAPAVRRDLLEVEEDSYEAVMAVNLKAPVFLGLHVARVMLELRGKGQIDSGAIINITSIRSYAANPAGGEYCISKACLSRATSLLAARLVSSCIRVYEVRPGLIETEMAGSVRGRYDRLIDGGLTPIRRWGQPGEVARAVAALVQGGLPAVSGHAVSVDGGFHLRRF